MTRFLSKVVVFAIAAVFAPTVMAAKGLGQAEAEQLIKGNTVEGTNKWNKQMTWYFDGSGQLRKRDHRGNKSKATWSISKKGELCYLDKHQQREVCGAIVPRGEGKYEVEIPGQWKWNKFSPGNPYNL